MRRWLTVLAVGGVAACSGGAPPGSPQAECDRQADNDPAVVAMYTQSEGAYTFSRIDRDQIAFLKKQAFTRCMRAKGLAPPGGVQPVQPQR